VNPIFLPLARALGQLNDRVFLGVLALSLVMSGLVFFGLHVAAIGVVHFMLELHGWWAWVADILGSVAAMALSLWLFLPLAAMIGTLFIDSIARAVERRWYPGLAPAVGASIMSQIWLGLALGLRILLLNILALLCVLLIPGIGLVLGWAIAAYGLGRGLFMAVALRRMPRGAAEMVYRRARWVVLAQGAAMALAGTVPLLNLLIPVIGTAAMVHVLDRAIGGMRPRVAPVQG
jgi:CysZ protein